MYSDCGTRSPVQWSQSGEAEKRPADCTSAGAAGWAAGKRDGETVASRLSWTGLNDKKKGIHTFTLLFFQLSASPSYCCIFGYESEYKKFEKI